MKNTYREEKNIKEKKILINFMEKIYLIMYLKRFKFIL